ncbi:ankyrin-3-like [Phymastichus coffea]|uniref:ankyrin-3-like n=1 Tax=Phymastichus coffea TaxID=108790 RepID=UPI00273C5FD0|nr:ankyrin-3-like [Phymastichus coffea]
MAHITKLLKQYGFTKIEDTDANGDTVLHQTIKNKKLTQKKMIEVLEILFERGVHPDMENKKKETILQLALKNRMQDVINLLLTHATNITSAAHFFITDEYEKYSQFSRQTKLDSEIGRVESESANFVEWLISRGFTFDRNNKRNQSALCMAIELNLQHILPVLLRYTKKITSVDQQNRTLLCYFLESKTKNFGIDKNWYSKRYEAEIVKILLDRGVSVDTENNSERSLIRIAIDNEEDVDVVLMLLERSTNTNRKNCEDETLFHVVIRKWINSAEGKSDYYSKIMQVLIAKGADLNEPDKYGKRPLVYAIENRNLHLVELLRANGSDFNVTTKDGKPLVDLVFTSICQNTSNEADMTLFQLLLKHVTGVCHKNFDGDLPFHTLIWKWLCSPDTENHYYAEIGRALIDKGADVNKANDYGTIPLFHAVERHNLRVVEFLREHGANFDATTENGDTLMHWFVKSNDFIESGNYEPEMKLFDLLLKYLTNIHHKNSFGDTPLRMAIRKWATSEKAHTDYYTKVTRVLMDRLDGANETHTCYGETLPFDAIEKHNLGVVEFLDDNGADFSMRTEDGETLMHLLVKSSGCWQTNDKEAEMKIFKLLISKGCRADARDKSGSTPLHVAAMHADSCAIQLLIEHGARVDCRNNDMETPLHFAMRNKQFESTAIQLVELGADVNAKDSKGQTPLHKIAIEQRTKSFYKMLRMLLLYGADVNARDSENRTVLSCARTRDLNDWQQKCRACILDYNELRRRTGEGFASYSPLRVSIGECGIKDTASDVVLRLAEHSVKLKAANLPWDERINGSLGLVVDADARATTISSKAFCQLYYEKSAKEVEALRSTMIDSHTSLYHFLHMNYNRRRIYLNNNKMELLVRSSVHEFPVYADLIFACFFEATVRKVLMAPARNAWAALTRINMPTICIDLIFSFLSNADLFLMIDADLSAYLHRKYSASTID